MEKVFNAFEIVNDFSRQLFLIKTPSDFDRGIKSAFKSILPDIELYVYFRYQWEENTFEIVSNNYLKDIDSIPLARPSLEELLSGIIKKNKTIENNDMSLQRKSDISTAINTSLSGSDIVLPLAPINEATGILYAYSRTPQYFTSQKKETIKLLGNMISRSWNIINYQAIQIKSHKKAELEVATQKNLMKEIFDYLPINIFTKNKEGKFVYINKNAEDSLGIKVDNSIGKTADEVYGEDIAKKLEADDMEVRATGQPKLSNHEIEINGKKRYLFTGKKIITTADKTELLIGFSIDVSKNILVSREIEEQKKFFQQIFNTVPSYIFIKDGSGNFQFVNKAFAELMNIEEHRILSNGLSNFTEIVVNEALTAKTDNQVLNFGKTVEYEESIIFKDEMERWYHTTKKPLPDKDGNLRILGVSIDITDRKKYSDELLKAKQTKELFLANMSHEIRTPINGIVGMVNLLEEIPATEEQKKYLNAIKTSSKNLRVIINDILDLSAIESGNIKFEQIGFNLKTFFNTLISSFNYAAKQKGISITLNFDPYIDQVVIGDPVRLNQVVSNLIGNAVKFTKTGFVKVYALKLSEVKGIGHFQFIVDDSGIGIDEDKIQKIFENFEQGNVAINRKYGGTGLGLAIVKKLVEAQEGSIEVKSKTGKGTKFTVNLRYEIGSEDDLDDQKKNKPRLESLDADFDLSKHKILLVEDNEVNLLYTRKILNNWNCTPEEAKNGLIALEKLKENDYDLILMDVRMPLMDGFEATKFIRSNFEEPKSNTPIIALTANAIKGDDQKCIDAGMNDYLSKPFQPETLKNKIVGNMELEGFTRRINEKSKEELNSKSAIDLTYLRNMSGNDKKFIIDMVQSFVKQAPNDIRSIWDNYLKNKFDELGNLIHKIKPSVTFMGIHDINELIVQIEEDIKSEKTEQLKSRLEKIEEIYQRALTELKDQFDL